MSIKNNSMKVWLGIMLSGAAITGIAYLPFMNPPQCPYEYTQAQIVSSRCIVGVNMGAAFVWMLGVLIFGVGCVGTIVTLIIRVFANRKNHS